MHQRAALHTREGRLIDRLGVLLFTEDHTAAGSAKGLVGSGGDELSVRNGILVHSAGYQTRDMRHIDHQVRADLIGNLAEALEVDCAGICGRAADDHLGLAFLRDLKHLIIIDTMGFGIDAVADDVEILAADVDG